MLPTCWELRQEAEIQASPITTCFVMVWEKSNQIFIFIIIQKTRKATNLVMYTTP